MPAASLPRSEHYSFEVLEDGIGFGRARAEGTALSNTGVVDLGGSTLIFDTSLTQRSAREIRDASMVLTGRPPSLSVNSHWHLDHMLGNQVFADRPIYASRRTGKILRERRAELDRELARESLEAEIRQLEIDQRAKGLVGKPSPFDGALRLNRALLDETGDRRLTLPTDGFDRELRLPGDRDARLLSFGAGHTESDTVLFLGKARVIFAGDLVVAGTHPNVLSGDPEHWLTVLDEIEALRPERIATGHGPLRSTEGLDTMRDYLSTVVELSRAPGEPEIPARFREFTEPDQFARNLAHLRARSSATHGSRGP